jgi:hypothetical protein
MKNTYTCSAYIRITVEADDEFEASQLAGMEMDIGDIEWDVDPSDPLPQEESNQ